MFSTGQFIEVFLSKHARLVQELINKCRLAVINVGNYRYITNII